MNEFIRRFRTIVQTYPEQEAINVDNNWHITYAALERQVDECVALLKHHGIGSGHLVAINLAKSPEYLIYLLAAWAVGAAFIPIDPNLPPNRREFFIKQSTPNLIIHPNRSFEYYHHQKRYDENLAYIFFTSGSTGQPKGVMVSHSGIVNFIDQQIKMFEISSGQRFLFYLSTQFDASISDIGTTFLSGATLCIATRAMIDAHHLPIILSENNITHIDIPPSLLTILDIEQMPQSLTTIIIGGEVTPLCVVRQWAKKFRVVNVYGPTEATVCTSMMHCTDQFESASIGTPIANMSYHILDEHFQPALIGELYISGVGLGLGYVNNIELTQEKFITINNTRCYKTGDLVKQSESGHYIFLGRIDRQLKIRGQLVEPEEIETALSQHPAVKRAAVVYQELNQRQQLLAIVEAPQLTANILFYFLKNRLPSWMMPNQIILVDKLPKNINEKIDYSALHRSNFSAKNTENDQNSNQFSKKLQQLWQNVFKLTDLPSIHDDLFQTLGASSLDVIKLVVNAELQGLYLSTELLYHLPTIDDLSSWLQYNQSLSMEFMPTSILKRECNHSFQSLCIANNQSTDILITGVTGFLGIHILEELLIKTNHHITCLIRADNNENALEKIKQVAIKYQRKLTPYLARIHVVIGNIAQPKLGLSDSDWHDLCQRIGHIYHCAAEVNMTKTFAELKTVNLDGTKEIAKLASTLTKKRIYYLSTLSVFVATDQNTGVCSESNNLETIKYVYGGYAQSKWAAEYYLRHSSLEVTIFRPGLITGHSVTALHSDHDYLALFVKGLQAIGSLPKGHWQSIQFDATPVDFAAKAIVHLSLRAATQCYHVVNTQHFSLPMVVKAMQKLGFQLKESKNSNWLATQISDDSMAASYMALCRLLPPQHQVFERFRTMDLFQATDVEFDQKNTLQQLANSGISCPKADEILLDKYLARMLHAP